MVFGDMIKEIIENKDLMKVLVNLEKEKAGIVEELEDREIKKIGNTAHITIPKKYLDEKNPQFARVQIIKKQEEVKQS